MTTVAHHCCKTCEHWRTESPYVSWAHCDFPAKTNLCHISGFNAKLTTHKTFYCAGFQEKGQARRKPGPVSEHLEMDLEMESEVEPKKRPN